MPLVLFNLFVCSVVLKKITGAELKQSDICLSNRDLLLFYVNSISRKLIGKIQSGTSFSVQTQHFSENNDTFNMKVFVIWQDNFWMTTKNAQQSPDLNYNVQCDLNTII